MGVSEGAYEKVSSCASLISHSWYQVRTDMNDDDKDDKDDVAVTVTTQ